VTARADFSLECQKRARNRPRKIAPIRLRKSVLAFRSLIDRGRCMMPVNCGGSRVLVGLSAALAVSLLGRAGAEPSGIDFSSYRPSAPATRIETSEAPKIDGDVSDAVWTKAPIIDKFYQIEPKAGETATRRTVARVLYDRNAIYVSFYCYDDDPKNIPSGAKARDSGVSNGDIVRLYLDPEQTRRNAYAFEVNPLGGRLDALIQNNADYLPDWKAGHDE
jgi:hypothetical protein